MSEQGGWQANITVVMVTYKSAELCDQIAATLCKFKQAVLVDNNSQDDLVKMLRVHPAMESINCRYISSPKNIGYGAGNNLGIDKVNTRYALILNPDCEISQVMLHRLFTTAEAFPLSALVGVTVSSPEGITQPSYDWYYDPKASRFAEITPSGVLSSRWLSGCCLLIRTSFFKVLGGFDERFFMYYEEFDVCQRAIAHGFDVILQPAAIVLHRESTSSKPSLRTRFIKDLHWARSRRLYREKCGMQRRHFLRTMVRTAALVMISFIYVLGFQYRRGMKTLARGCAECF